MKERFKEALKINGLKLTEVALGIGLKRDTLRKALDRNSLNEGYLILIEQKYGISKEWLRDGQEPILKDTIDSLSDKISEDSYSLLDRIDPEKIVAYILLKESLFKRIPSFLALVEKFQTSKRLEDIAKKHKKD